MALLQVEHLAKSYGSIRAVVDVSLSVNAGEVFGLLGPNGAGKSTSMLMIAGLLPRDAGTILLHGCPFEARSMEQRRAIGLAPQELALYPDLTAAENLDFVGRLYGLRGSALVARRQELLESVGLTAQSSRLVREFSGGMKRRMNLAAALVHRPQLLILDEPTVGVDPQSRNHLLECVRQQAAAGAAVIYCSHYMEEVAAVCHRVAIVDQGLVLASGAIHELMALAPTEVTMQLTGPTAALQSDENLGLTIQHHALQLSGVGREVPARLPEVMRRLAAAAIGIEHIDWKPPSLERLFLQLTGRALRD